MTDVTTRVAGEHGHGMPAHIGKKDLTMSKVHTTEFWVNEDFEGSKAHEALKDFFPGRVGTITQKTSEVWGPIAAFRIELQEGETWPDIFMKVAEAVYVFGGSLRHYVANPDQTLLENQREAFLGVQA